MFISDCVDNPYFDFLQCTTLNQYISSCLCVKQNSPIINFKNLNNNEIYNEFYAETAMKNTFHKSDSEFKNIRILDCFNKFNNVDWICNTYGNNKKISICQCCDLLNEARHIEFISTFHLYRNLDDKVLNITTKSSENDKHSQIEHKNANLETKNSLKDNLYHEQNVTSSTDLLYHQLSFLTIICIFIVFIAIIFVYKRLHIAKTTRKKGSYKLLMI